MSAPTGHPGPPAVTDASRLTPPTRSHDVTFAEATQIWWRIGWLSFGGPTAQIALMHRLLVEERRWLSEREFLDALGFCMLLPGPEAMQLATYAGWRLHGVRGGLVAGGLFVLPGACVVLALSLIYALLGHVPFVLAAFHGIRAAVLAIVVEALVRLARRAITGSFAVVVAVLSFVALFAFDVPFPIVVLCALLLGWVLPPSLATSLVRSRAKPPATLSSAHSGPTGAFQDTTPDFSAAFPARELAPPSISGSLRTALAWLAVWFVPLGVIAIAFGPEHILSKLSWLFSKLATVTFGGAYAVLAWLSQEVVERHGWLTARQMLDGLGLAETTPGPLILVTEFVGFMAALNASPASRITFGVAGAVVALWATFAPCLLWIFTGAPWVAAISRWPRLQSGLAVLTAAVLGVIANLSVWFALHVLFGHVSIMTLGPMKLSAPQLTSLDAGAAGTALLAGVLLLRFHWSLHRVLVVAALLGLLTLLTR